MEINNISTEQRNKETINIDQASTSEIVKMINDQDKLVALAIEKELDKITQAIDAGYECLLNGGRVIYFGAGTSGRLGVLDASEIYPTFGEKDLFIGLIAGGKKAIQFPVENAEDDEKLVIQDFQSINASSNDLFVGIAASGRTPYVIAGLNHANHIGASSVSISTAKNSQIGQISKINIEPVVGPEVITGSTRMKSGTAQKMVLNMISTGIMIKLGKTYSNLMVDLKPTNKKLILRSIGMLKNIIDIDDKQAKKLLIEANYNVKVAIVMHKKNISQNEAIKILKKHNDILRDAIE